MPTILAVEHHRQEEDAGCLAACVQMALAHLGITVSQRTLNHLLGLTPAGVPASHLTRVEKYGVRVTLRSGTLRDLFHPLEQDVPPIIFVNTGQLSYWSLATQHAVLITGYDNNDVLIDDPAFDEAPQRVDSISLMLAWDEFDNRYAVIRSINK